MEKLIKATDDENKEIYVLGDLNCDILKADEDSNLPTKKIKSLYEIYQLSQLIDKPTRITMTTKSLIDHIVTNAPEKNSNTGVIHTGISDHSLKGGDRRVRIFSAHNNWWATPEVSSLLPYQRSATVFLNLLRQGLKAMYYFKNVHLKQLKSAK